MYPNYYSQMPALQSNVNWIYVDGLKGAREQPVTPGDTLWLMDKNKPIIYPKTADSVGMVTLRAFELKEISLESLEEDNYVSKAEFAKLSQKLDALTQNLSGILDELGGVQKQT